MEKQQTEKLKSVPVLLNSRQRTVIQNAIREVRLRRKWLIRAIHVRTNHIHIVVSALVKPECIVRDFKSYSTRSLRSAGLWLHGHSPWVDGSSKRFLWKETSVANACEYVINGQGADLPESF